MEALGRHALAEFGGCDNALLNDPDQLLTILEEAAVYAKATVIEKVKTTYGKDGFLGMIIISESHLTAYSLPGTGNVVIDVFTCGDEVNPLVAISYLQEKFQAKYFTIKQILRGDINEIAKYSNKSEYQVA